MKSFPSTTKHFVEVFHCFLCTRNVLCFQVLNDSILVELDYILDVIMKSLTSPFLDFILSNLILSYLILLFNRLDGNI